MAELICVDACHDPGGLHRRGGLRGALPALAMAVLIAVTRLLVSLTPLRFTETETLLPSEKPGPAKLNVA